MMKQRRIHEKSVPVSCNLSGLPNNETLPDNETSKSNVGFRGDTEVHNCRWLVTSWHVHQTDSIESHAYYDQRS